jgi:Polyketide cyclase / dehydrase and lipid transport
MSHATAAERAAPGAVPLLDQRDARPRSEAKNEGVTHRLRTENLGFLESAPVRLTCTHTVRASSASVFDQVAARPEDWPLWFMPALWCAYEGQPPHGVGTVRHLFVRGDLRFRETVLAWEDGKRFAYRVEECNLPGIRACMERWTIDALNDSACRVGWTLAVDGRRPVRMVLRAGRGAVDRAFGRSMARLEAHIAGRR